MENSRTGELLGIWRLDRLIGAGGMGEVYLANRVDGIVKQLAAVKVLRARYNDGATDEADVLRPLSHPNITRCFDDGITPDGHRYLVMEYVDGPPITDYADQKGLSIHARLNLFLQACAAIEHAHHHVVVHADLKPGNILVDREGFVKIIDFGIAHRCDAQPRQEPCDVFSGPYASPEQIRRERLGYATDIYSMGVVLYELVCGHEPVSPLLSAAELERQILEETPRPPSFSITQPRLKWNYNGRYIRLEPETIARMRGGCRLAEARKLIAGDVDRICLFALRKEACRRYRSIDDLTSDLHRVLEGRRPAIARSGDPMYSALRAAQRKPLEIMAAVAAVTAILGTWTFFQLSSERIQATLEHQAQFRRPTQFATTALEGTLRPALASDPRFRPGAGALDSVLDRAGTVPSKKTMREILRDDVALMWRRAKRIIAYGELLNLP